MIYWATVIIMTRRLARYENGQSPVPRWGGQRPRPASKLLYLQALSLLFNLCCLAGKGLRLLSGVPP